MAHAAIDMFTKLATQEDDKWVNILFRQAQKEACSGISNVSINPFNPRYSMKTHLLSPEHRASWCRTCLILMIPAALAGTLSAAGLTAQWKFDEISPPYSDSGTNGMALAQDPGTATAVSATGIDGSSAQLNWQPVPGVATRLSATGAALQKNSFGFSFWINPIYLNANEVLISKEMAFDNSIPNFLRKSWQVQVLGSGKLELIVRGDNRANGDFFGAVQSTATLTLQSDTPDWIHVAGGYDSITGALSLFVDGTGNFTAGTPGATSSDGAPLSFGTQKNGNDFVEFAAGVLLDEAQIYDAPLAADEVAFLRANPDKTVAERPVPSLAAHWKLDEPSSPYASSASAPADLTLDPETTPALSETPSLIGNAAVLNFGTPAVATRLFTTAGAIQTDSFSFSFGMRPDSVSGDNVILMKEIPAYAGADPAYSLCSWKLMVLPDGNSDNLAPLQLVVRGSDRTGAPEPFFGDVTSGAQVPLNTQSDTWIHVAGGYDAVTGALSLYLNDGGSLNSADSRIVAAGANNSDGSPLSIGTSRNGTNFNSFAVGAAIDDVQMYDGLLSASQVALLEANPGQILSNLLAF